MSNWKLLLAMIVVVCATHSIVVQATPHYLSPRGNQLVYCSRYLEDDCRRLCHTLYCDVTCLAYEDTGLLHKCTCN